MITEFKNKTPEGASDWWDSMIEKGLYLHPDDDPTEFVDGQGKRLLDDLACKKIDVIYDQMFTSLGESKSLDIGLAAWYKHQGYVWNEKLNEFQPKNQ